MIGIRVLSMIIRFFTGQRVSDPTSGFRAVNRKGIDVFARYYPHDYPEPEAVAVAVRAGLRIQEIPVAMSPRTGGRSSINLSRSFYYMVKVTLAIFIRSIERYKS